MNRRAWILISGVMWAMIGVLLLYKGLRFLSEGNDPVRASWWVAGGLLVGFIKGRFVLSKTVERLTSRIEQLSMPIRFRDVYPLGYWILLSSMMILGFMLRLVPLEVRGFVDVAVGSALINGAMLYFKRARAYS